ncbi:MAG: PepSY domain-containing protein [Maricaulaceae bacterium]
MAAVLAVAPCAPFWGGQAMARDAWRAETIVLAQARRGLTLSQALQIARRRYPGAQLLDSVLQNRPSGAVVYRMKLRLNDGRRIDFDVNARTGAVMYDSGRRR